jgi:hypothetical protein
LLGRSRENHRLLHDWLLCDRLLHDRLLCDRLLLHYWLLCDRLLCDRLLLNYRLLLRSIVDRSDVGHCLSRWKRRDG